MMQDFQKVLKEKQFQIYSLTEYCNILFAYSPILGVLSEQTLRILPTSIRFTGLKKYCFQTLTIGNLTVNIYSGFNSSQQTSRLGFFYFIRVQSFSFTKFNIFLDSFYGLFKLKTEYSSWNFDHRKR